MVKKGKIWLKKSKNGGKYKFLFSRVIQSLFRFENVGVLTNMHMDDHRDKHSNGRSLW